MKDVHTLCFEAPVSNLRIDPDLLRSDRTSNRCDIPTVYHWVRLDPRGGFEREMRRRRRTTIEKMASRGDDGVGEMDAMAVEDELVKRIVDRAFLPHSPARLPPVDDASDVQDEPVDDVEEPAVAETAERPDDDVAEAQCFQLCDGFDEMMKQLLSQDGYVRKICLEAGVNGRSDARPGATVRERVEETLEVVEGISRALRFRDEAETRAQERKEEEKKQVRKLWWRMGKFALLSAGGAAIMSLLENKKKKKNRLRRKRENARRAQMIKNNQMIMAKAKELKVDQYPRLSEER